ncbi:unnamed protein product, partial [Brassica oleracea]
ITTLAIVIVSTVMAKPTISTKTMIKSSLLTSFHPKIWNLPIR